MTTCSQNHKVQYRLWVSDMIMIDHCHRIAMQIIRNQFYWVQSIKYYTICNPSSTVLLTTNSTSQQTFCMYYLRVSLAVYHRPYVSQILNNYLLNLSLGSTFFGISLFLHFMYYIFGNRYCERQVLLSSLCYIHRSRSVQAMNEANNLLE